MSGIGDVMFVPNPLVETELAQAPEVKSALTLAAEEVAARAKELAPVDTGALRDSIHVETTSDGDIEVVADVDYAIFVEFGSEDTPMQPYLRPAADSTIGRGTE